MCKDRRWKRSISIGSEKVMALVLGMMLLLSVKVSAQAAPEAGSEGWNRDEVVSYLQKGEAASAEWTPLCLAAAGTAPSSSQVQQVEDAIAQGAESSQTVTRPGKADPFGFGLWPGSRRRIRCQPSGKALQPGTDGPAGSQRPSLRSSGPGLQGLSAPCRQLLEPGGADRAAHLLSA